MKNMSVGKLGQIAKSAQTCVINKAAAHSQGLSVIAVLSIVWLILLLAGPTRSFAVQCLGLALFYGFLAAILSRTSVWTVARELTTFTRWLLFAVGAVFAACSGWYFHRYHFFPSWDHMAYWSRTLQFNARLNSSVHSALLHMVDTVNTADYNDLLCWIASLPVRIFPQWAATFFIELLMFLIPASLVITLFVFSRLKQVVPSLRERLVVPALFICFLSVPVVLRPIFSGYLDGIAATLFVVVLVAVFDKRFPYDRVLAVLCGVGICGTFLLRRWLVYAVIGLAAAALVYWLFVVLFRRDERMLLLRKLLGNAVLMAVAACVVLLPFQGFLYRSFFGGQSTAYRSWTKWDSVTDKLVNIGQTVGWLWIGGALAATVAVCVIAAVKRSCLMLEHAALLVACLVGMFGALLPFWQIQDMTSQHWYIMIFFFAICCFLSLMTVCSLVRRAWANKAGTAAIALLSVVGLLHGFSMLTALPTNLNTALNNLTGAVIQRPIRQNDYSEKVRFVQFLREQTGGAKLVYFAAASANLNSSLPRSVCLPECSATVPFPYTSADVDSRDGFNTRFFTADFVVTSSPVSLHMAEQNEQVVSFLNQQVMDADSTIGKHYRKIRTFTFANGYNDTANGTTKVFVYQRTSDFSKDDVLYVKSVFHKKYPQLPELFDKRFDSYLSQLAKKRSSASQ